MEKIQRTYEVRHHEQTEYGTWDGCKSRYRLSLNYEDGVFHFEYEKFKCGFGSWENTDDVASNYSTSSYLWNDTLHPTWDEMSTKEGILKEEFIRHFNKKIEEHQGEIEWREERIKEHNDVLQRIRGTYIKRHSFGLEPQG
jgi:hypothetical protein